MHGDNFFTDNLFGLVDRKMNPGIFVRACTFITDSPRNSGIFTLSEENRLIRFDEKRDGVKSVIANAAIYRFSKNILSYVANLSPSQSDISRDVITEILDKIELVALNGEFIDIGTKHGLNQANLIANIN
jgi:NDP-sugar pyrophosphorylase family protein